MENFGETKFPIDIKFIRFLSKSFRKLREKFTAGLTKLHFGCPAGKVWLRKIETFSNSLDLFGGWANNFRPRSETFRLCSKITLKEWWQLYHSCLQDLLRRNILFGKNYRLFGILDGHYVHSNQKFFGRFVKIAFYVFWEMIAFEKQFQNFQCFV